MFVYPRIPLVLKHQVKVVVACPRMLRTLNYIALIPSKVSKQTKQTNQTCHACPAQNVNKKILLLEKPDYAHRKCLFQLKI